MSTNFAPSRSQMPSIAPTSLPILNRLEGLIKTLNDTTQRDDLKYKALKEISENFEELSNTPVYTSLLDNLLRAFLKLLQETTPQFISENNTLVSVRTRF